MNYLIITGSIRVYDYMNTFESKYDYNIKSFYSIYLLATSVTRLINSRDLLEWSPCKLVVFYVYAVKPASSTYGYNDHTTPMWSYPNQPLIMPLPSSPNQ